MRGELIEEEKQLPNNSEQGLDEASELYQAPDTSSEEHSEKEMEAVWDFKRKKEGEKIIPATLSKCIFNVHLSTNSVLILFREKIHPS